MKNNSKFFTVLKERWQIYLLIGPFLILFVLMTVLPILSSVVLSFFNYDIPPSGNSHTHPMSHTRQPGRFASFPGHIWYLPKRCMSSYRHGC